MSVLAKFYEDFPINKDYNISVNNINHEDDNQLYFVNGVNGCVTVNIIGGEVKLFYVESGYVEYPTISLLNVTTRPFTYGPDDEETEELLESIKQWMLTVLDGPVDEADEADEAE
jgi:hypothetical protein